MNEAKCVVCEKLLDSNESGAVCYITTITPVDPLPGSEDDVKTYERHMRTLTLCKEHWADVERYLYADK